MTIEKSEWLRRYKQQFLSVVLDDDKAQDCVDAVTFEEASDGYEDDPEGSADMEMSYWEE